MLDKTILDHLQRRAVFALLERRSDIHYAAYERSIVSSKIELSSYTVFATLILNLEPSAEVANVISEPKCTRSKSLVSASFNNSPLRLRVHRSLPPVALPLIVTTSLCCQPLRASFVDNSAGEVLGAHSSGTF